MEHERFWARIIATIGALAVLSACSGSQRSVTPLAHSTAAAAAIAKGRVLITIPRGSSTGAAGRRPAYISPATQSATLNVTPQGSSTSVSGYPQTVNLTPTSTGCSSTLASTQCVIQLALAPGSDDLTLTTYDQTGGTGNVLSAAQTVPFTIVAGAANTVTLTLGGVPASVGIFSTQGTLVPSGAGFTLPPNGTATALIFGIDADDNIIVGPGAPTVSATSSASAQVTVTEPTATAPNQITLAANALSTTITLTMTVTPATSSGASAISTTASIAPQPARIYVANYYGGDIGEGAMTAYDDNGNQQTLSGSFVGDATYFPLDVGYDPNNNLLYVSSFESINAYDLSGDPRALSGSDFPVNRPDGIAYDPANSFLYVSGKYGVAVYDQNGNQQTLSGTFPDTSFPSGIVYCSANGLLYVANLTGSVTAYDKNGNRQTLSGSFAGLNSPSAIAYDTANGLLYVTNDNMNTYTYTVTAYDTSGNEQSLSGTFPDLSMPLGIAYDPDNGFLYVTNSYNNTVTAYDQNGNLQNLAGSFSGLTTPGGIVFVP